MGKREGQQVVIEVFDADMRRLMAMAPSRAIMALRQGTEDATLYLQRLM